jgi:predicted nucleotidyltransferase
MHPPIENNREAIAGLCRLHGVRSLEAFGSIRRDNFDAGRSDVDVLVEFEPQAADSFSNFLDLKESLEALFQRPVDLVELRAIRTADCAITSSRANHLSMPQRDPGVYRSSTTPLRQYAFSLKQYLAYQITRSECDERRDCGGNFAAN